MSHGLQERLSAFRPEKAWKRPEMVTGCYGLFRNRCRYGRVRFGKAGPSRRSAIHEDQDRNVRRRRRTVSLAALPSPNRRPPAHDAAGHHLLDQPADHDGLRPRPATPAAPCGRSGRRRAAGPQSTSALLGAADPSRPPSSTTSTTSTAADADAAGTPSSANVALDLKVGSEVEGSPGAVVGTIAGVTTGADGATNVVVTSGEKKFALPKASFSAAATGGLQTTATKAQIDATLAGAKPQ